MLARDGLVGLGFSPQEADKLLDGAPGDTPEDLIAHGAYDYHFSESFSRE
jgi:hypothetical protein